MRPTLGTSAAMAAVLLLIGPPEGATARPAEVPASFAQSLRSGTALEYTPPRHIDVAHVLDALAGGMVVGAALPCASRCWVALGERNFPTVSGRRSGTKLRSTNSKALIKMLSGVSSVRLQNYPHLLPEGVRRALCAVAPGSLSYMLCARAGGAATQRDVPQPAPSRAALPSTACGPHDARALCSAETRSCCCSWHAARSEIRSCQASVTRLMRRRARQISTRRHAAATTTVDGRRTNRCDGHLTGWTSLARQSATAHRHHWRSLTAHGVRRGLDGDGARRGRLFHHWRRRGRRARARSGAGKVMKKAGADFWRHVESAGARCATWKR